MSQITRKRMLYKTKVDYQLDASGQPVNDYAMNHVLGCSHGCKYPCYAMKNALRFRQVESYEDWCEPKLVANTLELLNEELARKKDVRRVHLCFTTDPLPYIAPEGPCKAQRDIQNMTMSACETINAHGIPVTLLTKGLLPRFAFGTGGPLVCPGMEGYGKPWTNPHPDNYYGISLVSLNGLFREAWEPHTAPYEARLASLRALHDAGCKTWVSMEPFPAFMWNMGRQPSRPDLTDLGDVHAGLKYLLTTISFVDRIVFGRWNYNTAMPGEIADVESWYRGCAMIVREFCAHHDIECVIKKGVE